MKLDIFCALLTGSLIYILEPRISFLLFFPSIRSTLVKQKFFYKKKNSVQYIFIIIQFLLFHLPSYPTLLFFSLLKTKINKNMKHNPQNHQNRNQNNKEKTNKMNYLNKAKMRPNSLLKLH